MPARRAAQIVTIHDLFFLSHTGDTRADIRRDYAALVASHARRADAIVTSTQYGRGQIIERLGVAGDRIYICPPGAPTWLTLGREPNVPSDGCILFVGTLEVRKNVGALLDAYERLLERRPDVPRLILAGRATAAASKWLARINSAPLASRVVHLGYVNDDAREELYRSARVLVMPSHDEGFGLPALEAMSAGVPVIVSARGSLPEVVQDAGAQVDPLDIDALAAAIERAAFDQHWAVCRCAGGPRPGAPFHVDRIRSDAAPRVSGSGRTSSGTPRCGAGCPPPRHMKIAIDARELHGKPTGVGRLIRELLDELERHVHGTCARVHLPRTDASHVDGRNAVGATGTCPVWSERRAQMSCSHRRTADHSFRLFRWSWQSTMCRSPRIQNGSRGAKAHGDVRPRGSRPAPPHASSRSRNSQSAKSWRIWAVDASKISVAYPGVTALTDARGAEGSALGGTVLCVGSIFNRRHVPELIDGFARARERPARDAARHRRRQSHDSARRPSRAHSTDGDGRSHSSAILCVRRRAASAVYGGVGVRLPVRIRRLRPDAPRGTGGRTTGARCSTHQWHARSAAMPPCTSLAPILRSSPLGCTQRYSTSASASGLGMPPCAC